MSYSYLDGEDENTNDSSAENEGALPVRAVTCSPSSKEDEALPVRAVTKGV